MKKISLFLLLMTLLSSQKDNSVSYVESVLDDLHNMLLKQIQKNILISSQAMQFFLALILASDGI